MRAYGESISIRISIRPNGWGMTCSYPTLMANARSKTNMMNSTKRITHGMRTV